MAFCSAVTLCFAAICAVVSAALLAIAFSTDNWQVISVKRDKLEVSSSESRFNFPSFDWALLTSSSGGEAEKGHFHFGRKRYSFLPTCTELLTLKAKSRGKKKVAEKSPS